MTELEIRPLRAGDEPALMDVCLRTGDAGGDATGLLDQGELLGTLWCMPYLVLEPELVSVVAQAGQTSDGQTPVGYVLGALDSAAFHAAADEHYWPQMRDRFPIGGAPKGSLDELMVALIHDRGHADGSRAESELDERYPSHLHIDLLPEAQGLGFGRRLIERLIGQLGDRGSRGVHLGVSRNNERAIEFYRHVGFVEWDGSEDGINLTFVRDIG
jgi:ribosomal protein S18 acetylase RimI-like enzyme